MRSLPARIQSSAGALERGCPFFPINSADDKFCSIHTTILQVPAGPCFNLACGANVQRQSQSFSLDETECGLRDPFSAQHLHLPHTFFHALVEGGTSDFAPTASRKRRALGATPGLAPAGP